MGLFRKRKPKHKVTSKQQQAINRRLAQLDAKNPRKKK